MLACIACSKRLNDSIDEDGSATPRSPASREAIKNLTAQIKEMALKVSGSYRYSKPSGLSREGQLRFMLESELAGSESATPSGGASTSARPSNVLSSSKIDLLRSSNSSSNGTPKFNNASEPMEGEEPDDECKEWISHVEPGVIITLISLEGGENQLKRIRFSRELFNKRQAQLWWTENQEKVLELYNIRPNTKGENGGDIPRSRGEERDGNVQEARDANILPIRPVSATSSHEADRSDDLQSCSDKYSMHSATNSSEQDEEQEQEQEQEAEWVEEDEPGVYITIYSSPSGAREVKRVRFSREKRAHLVKIRWSLKLN
ncbi:hypothetical protein SUGI_1204530 [Cryptomeria japonica]|nr:hypothetical protein SUGI_1204530 [Cryptomeria japonica]